MRKPTPEDGAATRIANVGVSPQRAAAQAEAIETLPEEGALLRSHAGQRLYGGAQYWRALHEFMLGASQGATEEVTVEEIVNAMGVDGYHDGVNYMRAICVIVVEKAQGFFDASLAKLRLRMLHIMSRLCTVAADALLAEGKGSGARGVMPPPMLDDGQLASPERQAEYMSVVAPVFQRFVTSAMAATMERCRHDVAAMTRYVSWDASSPTKDALQSLLVEPVHAALQARFEAAHLAREEAAKRRGRRRRRGDGEEAGRTADFASYDELAAGFAETLMTRRVTEPMRALINDLVQQIIRVWREEYCRTISVKVNACFLLPFCDTLPNFMRKEVGKYANEMGVAASSTASAGEAPEGDRARYLREGIDAAVVQRQSLRELAMRMRGGSRTPRLFLRPHTKRMPGRAGSVALTPARVGT